ITQKYGDPGVKLIDEQRFVYPVYVVFLLAPTIRADFAQLRFWTPVLLVVLTAISVLLWLDVLRWRPSWMVTVALVLFVLCSPQIVQGVEHSQLALAVGFLLALSAWCVVRNHL